MSDGSPRKPRTALRERVIVAVARSATRSFFRTVEVVGTEPPDGPTILASSHLYGFVDPVVLIAEVGHLPRFLAKATLWNNPAAKYSLNFARVIPVHRAADGSTTENATMFADALTALEGHQTLAIFAEGTTHDDPAIRPLRTGVARIALQAAGNGIDIVRVVPMGISYEDKVALRGRVLIQYGEPIEVRSDPDLLDADGDPDHEMVRAFTDHLQRSIESLTPHFTTTEEALALTDAADIARRDPQRPERDVPMGDVAEDARRLSRAEPERRGALVSLVARYRMLCGFVGLDDATVLRGIDLRSLLRRIVVLATLILLLSPFAVAGLFANLLPFLLVAVAGLLPKAPVSKGTIRVLVAAVAFPATWVTLALADADTGWFGNLARTVTLPVNAVLGPLSDDRTGTWAGLFVFIAAPLMGIVAGVVISRARRLLEAVLQWRTYLDRRGQLDLVRTRRAEVVTTTRALLEEAR